MCGMSLVCHVLHYIALHYIKNKHHWNWSPFPALMLRMNPASPLQLKSISGLHTPYGYAMLCRQPFHQPRCTRHGRSRFSPACCRLSRAGETRFLPILAGEASYTWAVYCEGPPNFSYVEEGVTTMRGHYYSSLQLTYTIKTRKKTQKCMKSINYLSLLRLSLLLPNCEGSHSVFIYKFKIPNSNMHASMRRPISPEHVIQQCQRQHSNDFASFETTRLSVAGHCVWSCALRDSLGG